MALPFSGAVTKGVDDFLGRVAPKLPLRRLGSPAWWTKRLPVAVFDLDETTFVNRAAKHASLPEWYRAGRAPVGDEALPASWDPYMHSLKDDIPNPLIAEEWRRLRPNHNITVLTARGDRALASGETGRDITADSLKHHGLKYDDLLMRPPELETLGSGPYKDEMLDRHLGGRDIRHFFDDHKGVVEMARGRGILTTHVPVMQEDEIPAAIATLPRRAQRRYLPRVEPVLRPRRPSLAHLQAQARTLVRGFPAPPRGNSSNV